MRSTAISHHGPQSQKENFGNLDFFEGGGGAVKSNHTHCLPTPLKDTTAKK